MLKTCRAYVCKYFYEEILGHKKKLFVDKALCDKFLANGTSPKCYVESKKDYYNLISVHDGEKWEHPMRFIDNILGDETECVEEKD